jgi:outer membrane lipoprotein-sorting protein
MKTLGARRLSLIQKSAASLAIALLFTGYPGGRTDRQEKPSAPLLTADQVVARLAKMNSMRAEALRSYSSVREYHLVLNGIIHRRADMVAKMTYHWPDQKDFTIISESGSEIMRTRVLKRILAEEKEAMQAENLRQTALTPKNYEFTLVDVAGTPQPKFYVLEVKPRVKNKYLYQGKIWVDPKDFAVARIEAEPAKNPSWWIKKTDIHVIYGKVHDFWLPAHNESVSEIRIFGRTVLTIEYKDYDLMDTHKLSDSSHVQDPVSSQTLSTFSLIR